MSAEDLKTITKAIQLIRVDPNIECSADSVTRMSERVVFAVSEKTEEIGATDTDLICRR